MAIEKDLSRIAKALETLVAKLDHIGTAVAETPMPPKDVPSAPIAEETGTQQATSPIPSSTTPTETDTPVPPAPAQDTPPPAPAVEISVDELNAKLVEEYNRLGSREPIDEVLREFGVQSISNLKPESYAEVLAKVAAK